MKKNYELLDAVVKKIETDPAHWYQSRWAFRSRFFQLSEEGQPEVPVCNTSYCVAGWAVVIARPGARFQWLSGDSAHSVVTGGRVITIDDYAQKLFGLTSREARDLFEGINTLERIKEIITNWKAKDGVSNG